jgi:hypothetical protein
MRFAHQRAGELLAILISDLEAGEAKEHAALIEAFKPILALRQTAQHCARMPPIMCIQSWPTSSMAATPTIR